MPRPVSPRTDFPPRTACSARRVSYFDFTWPSSTEVLVSGAVRDDTTDADGVTTMGEPLEIAVHAEDLVVTRLELEPPIVDVDTLIGDSLVIGFRSRARALISRDPELEGTPVGLLLEDLPAGTFVSHYALELRMQRAGKSRPLGRAAWTQADLCSGWRTDGMMMLAVRAGQRLPYLDLPPAPFQLAGDDGPALPPLPSEGMRRHRRIDVIQRDGEWVVDAWFRDSYVDSTGLKGSLHEYTIDATIGTGDHVIRAINAVAHALPWHECPAAVGFVGMLTGERIDALRTQTSKTLRGIESCTHLNNMLRSLADVPYLGALV
ncbi:MAG: DUF2889 domain-containing protein [Actinobacteria bacterium]|nr:MAG: DUF2889 domain-containing protein [Actinomycetota bacterium]